MNEMTRVRLMMAISAAVLITVGLFVLQAEGLSAWSVVIVATVVAIAVVALVLVVRALRDMKSGLPLQDERSKALNARAGYYAFYVSMYLMLGLALVFQVLEEHDVVLSNSMLLFIVVMIMGTSHLIFSAYLNRKSRRSST